MLKPADSADPNSEPAGAKSTAVVRGHEPALDGIRFFAFLAVFWFHVSVVIGVKDLFFMLPLAEGGVRAFFVLSGFLIGGILLDARDYHSASIFEKLRVFYARRSLRIFPVYYFVLAISSLLGAAGLHQLHWYWTDPWDWLYLTNVAVFLAKDFPGAQSHLWTLAVEEQFYLVAPLVILTLGNRKLSWLSVLAWIGCAVLRSFTSFDQGGLPWTQFDTLSLGIAAAIMQRERRFLGISLRAFVMAGIVFAILAVPTNIFMWGGGWIFHLGPRLTKELLGPSTVVGQWFLGSAVAALILAFWNGKGGLLRRFFGARPIAYLGKISYGLYLYHLFVMNICLQYVPFFHNRQWLGAATALILTVFISMLSWHFIEHPINELKRFFPYQKRETPKEPQAEIPHSDLVTVVDSLPFREGVGVGTDATRKHAAFAVVVALALIGITVAVMPLIAAVEPQGPTPIAFIDNAATGDPGVRSEFDDAYRAIAREQSDGRAPSDEWALGYNEREADGEKDNRMGMEADDEEEMQFYKSQKISNFRGTITLGSIAAHGDRAVAVYYSQFVFVRDGKRHVEVDDTCNDYWAKRGGRWVMTFTAELEYKRIVNGKVVTDDHAKT
jgi:peptidoglycan/LPS O-acetylase OafA/YrhL